MMRTTRPADLAVHESQVVRFEEVPDAKRRLRRLILCIDGGSGETIGRICWYSPTKRYCLHPEPNAVLDAEALRRINGAIETLMAARRDGTDR